MSQPRRRRRRRRSSAARGGTEPGRRAAPQQQEARDAEREPAPSRSRSRRRRRSRRRGSGPARTFSSSEDLVRSFASPRSAQGPAAPEDDTTLEDVIGELQSTHGVPQYPQEYRITLKVADDRRPANGDERTPEGRDDVRQPRREKAPRSGPVREKAPAPPAITDAAARRRKRRRRRGRSRGGDTD